MALSPVQEFTAPPKPLYLRSKSVLRRGSHSPEESQTPKAINSYKPITPKIASPVDSPHGARTPSSPATPMFPLREQISRKDLDELRSRTQMRRNSIDNSPYSRNATKSGTRSGL